MGRAEGGFRWDGIASLKGLEASGFKLITDNFLSFKHSDSTKKNY